MKITATIDNSLNKHLVTVQTNDTVQQVSIPPKSTGFGSSVNGGELLLLSLATCFCNDIYREAKKRNMAVSSVQVVFEAVFGSDGEDGSGFSYTANVVADAGREEIDSLIKHTDTIAEIHKTLRRGTTITLKN